MNGSSSDHAACSGETLSARPQILAQDPSHRPPNGTSSRRPALDVAPLARNLYRMKATTMTLSARRQSVFPQDWCERVGLARGGPVNVFDLGEAGLLIRPVRPPTRRELQTALAAARPRRGKPGEAERIVAEALARVREAA